MNARHLESAPQAQLLERWAARFVLLVAAGVLLVASVLLAYSQPVFDDFASGRIPLSQVGKWISWSYGSWTGRWAARGTAVVVMNLVDITRSYWLALLPLLIFEFLAAYALLSALFPGQLTRLQRLMGVGVAAVCFWASMPGPWSTMYWLTGNLENQFNLALSMLLVAGLVGGRPRGPAGTLALAALAAYSIGLHELFGLLTCIVLAVGMAVAFRVRASNRMRWAWVLLAGIVGFVVVYAAPGNGLRGDKSAVSGGDFVFTLKATVLYARDVWLPWVLDPRLLALTAVLVLLPAARRLRAPWLAWHAVPWRVLLPATTFACVFAGTAGPLWALGRGIPERTLDGIYLVFFVGWFASVFALVRGADGEVRFPRRTTRSGSAIALSLFAVALLASPNLHDAVFNWRYHLKPWRAAMQQRFQAAREARAEGELRLQLPPQPRRPRGHSIEDLSMDPKAAPNQLFALYYGLKWVWIQWPEGERVQLR